jgi:hypothetical protein
VDPDPDPGGPKTCGSGSGFGSGSATLLLTQFFFVKKEFFSNFSNTVLDVLFYF